MWGERLRTEPVASFYDTSSLVDHLPGDLWIHWIISRVYFALNPGSPFEAIPQYVFKLAPCAADLGIGLTLFLLARQMGHGSAGLVAAAIFTFNPASMFLTAIWGQWDAVATLFGLLALWLLLRGNVELSFPALAYAALVKPQYALLAPFFLLHFLFQADMWPVGRGHGSDDRRSWRVWRRSARRSLVALVLTMLVIVAIIWPFDVAVWLLPGRWNLIERVSEAYREYPLISLNAFNIWALLGQLNESDQLPFVFGLSYEIWGRLLFGVTYVVILLIVWRRPGERALLWACLALNFAAFMLPTRQHERYLFPAIAFGALTAAVAPRLLGWYAALSFAYFVNLYWAFDLDYPAYELKFLYGRQSVIQAAGLVNTILFAYLVLRGPDGHAGASRVLPRLLALLRPVSWARRPVARPRSAQETGPE